MTKTKITCKLTGEIGKPVKSHIIPRSFYSKEKTLIIPNDSDYHPKRSPIGGYDEEMLVEKGEKYFDKLDNYAFKLLIEERDQFSPFILNGINMGITLKKYDYKTLTIFFLSLLWRASVTSREEFKQVKLGPHHSDKIKDLILRPDDTENAKDYTIQLYRFVGNDYVSNQTLEIMKKGGGFLFPLKLKHEGINYYKLYLCDYVALIKVDSRKTKDALNILSPIRTLNIFNYQLDEETKAFNEIEKNYKNLPEWFRNECKNHI